MNTGHERDSRLNAKKGRKRSPDYPFLPIVPSILAISAVSTDARIGDETCYCICNCATTREELKLRRPLRHSSHRRATAILEKVRDRTPSPPCYNIYAHPFCILWTPSWKEPLWSTRNSRSDWQGIRVAYYDIARKESCYCIN